MLIDLDEKEIIFNVRLGGKDYSLHEPSVDQMRSMNKHLKSVKDKDAEYGELDVMKNFVVKLGLPEDETGKLGLSKLNLLVVKMVEGMSGKK